MLCNTRMDGLYLLLIQISAKRILCAIRPQRVQGLFKWLSKSPMCAKSPQTSCIANHASGSVCTSLERSTSLSQDESLGFVTAPLSVPPKQYRRHSAEANARPSTGAPLAMRSAILGTMNLGCLFGPSRHNRRTVSTTWG